MLTRNPKNMSFYLQFTRALTTSTVVKHLQLQLSDSASAHPDSERVSTDLEGMLQAGGVAQIRSINCAHKQGEVYMFQSTSAHSVTISSSFGGYSAPSVWTTQIPGLSPRLHSQLGHSL